jgi:predicted DsbA family dithiol-disulfide isomerase
MTERPTWLDTGVIVDIWSDVVCPWCAVGRARWVAALDASPHRDQVRMRWRSFELDPRAPRVHPGSAADRLARKYGMSVEQARGTYQRMAELGARDGLDFRFEDSRPGNTFDAHRLLHHALATGGETLQDRLKVALFQVYFTEGRPIGEHETLVAVAEETGLDPGEAGDVLAGERYGAEVRADQREAQELGIGVPFTVVNGGFPLPGAQSIGTLTRVLARAWAAADPAAGVS